MFTRCHFLFNRFFAFNTAVFLTSLSLLGCANTGQTVQTTEKLSNAEQKSDKDKIDPFENFNRTMFNFNCHIDSYVAKPISQAYIWVTPGFFKTGVSNFFSNLKDINVVLNDHMQGKFTQGAEDTGRFLTNSTLGLLGLFDVASDLGLKKHEEDFGQTLGVWGIPQGAYIVLPILGPTTARGVPGNVFDVAANPSSYVGMPVQVVSMLNTRANAEGALKFIDEAAIDPYVFTREAYLQNLQHMVTDGRSNSKVDILPLEDELFADDDKTVSKTGEKVASAPAATDKVNRVLEEAVESLDKANTELAASSEKIDRLGLATKKSKFVKKIKKN